MRFVSKINSLCLLALSLTFASSTVAAHAQKPAPTITPSAGSAAPHNWTKEQILTCTVAQCWRLAGKDESTFFDIIQQLAVISADNRGITLPEDAAAGQRAGEYIKAKTKEDHDALLFAIVDGSVRYTAAKSAK